jgi:CheY-like chemotaxis protein
MICQSKIAPALWACAIGISLSSAGQLHAETDTDRQLKLVLEQNRILQERVNRQEIVIETLGAKVANIEAAEAKRNQQAEDSKAAPTPAQGFDPGKIHISGEGGVAFFSSDKGGMSDGETALRRMRQRSYDLALCDWKMPGLNGEQIYERLRAINPSMSERMIFIIGDVVNDHAQQFLEAHQKVCLNKPFSLSEFRSAINTALARRGVA